MTERRPTSRLRIGCLLGGAYGQPPNACAYIRLVLPLTHPGLHDSVEVRFIELGEIEIFRPHVVIVQRLAASTEQEIDRLLEACASTCASLVYEIDDDLLAIGEDHPEFDYYKTMAPAVRRLASAANEVWVSTDHLRASIGDLNANVVVLHNELDARVWQPKQSRSAREDVRILYMGTTSHSDDFEAVFMPAYKQLRDELDDKVSVTLIGVTESPVAGIGVVPLPVPDGVGPTYPAFASWLQSLPSFDVGVAPLTSTRFNAAKSHIKWLEYTALGVATVASAIAEYPQSITHGEDGLLAGTSAAEFHTELRRVALDGRLRTALAEGARKRLGSRMGERAASLRLDRLRSLCGARAGST